MKLATLRDGSRDGLLAVVSQDHSLAHVATGRARSLQQLLDDWNFISPQLEDLYATLNHGKARHAFAFDPRQCMAPLPRAYGWAQAMGDDEDLHHAACQGFWAPTDAPRFELPTPKPGPLQVQAGLAVLTGDIAAGASGAQALEGVRLLLLATHWQPGPRRAQQRTAFAPLAVTPDALGPAWRQGRVHASLHLQAGSRLRQNLAADEATQWQPLGLGEVLARLAAAGPIAAGTLVGTGPLGQGLDDPPPGSALQLDCTGSDGASLFGAVAQPLHDQMPEQPVEQTTAPTVLPTPQNTPDAH